MWGMMHQGASSATIAATPKPSGMTSLRFLAGVLAASLLLTSGAIGQKLPVSLLTPEQTPAAAISRVDIRQPLFRGRLYAPTLADVPIETFTSAVEWLRNSGKVYPNRVLVLGDSRGSEAALLTGAYDKHVGGTPEGTERGRNVAWAALLKYLKAFELRALHGSVDRERG